MRLKFVFRAMLTATLALVVSGGVAHAQGQAPAKECGLVGSWIGGAGGSMVWTGEQTAGSKDARGGQMLLNFLYVGSYLLHIGGQYPTAAKLTPGHGVFEQTGNGPNAQYKYTWYSYATDSDGTVLYSVRVRGMAQNLTCDNVMISFTYEAFDGWRLPTDLTADALKYTTTGNAEELRLPLVNP